MHLLFESVQFAPVTALRIFGLQFIMIRNLLLVTLLCVGGVNAATNEMVPFVTELTKIVGSDATSGSAALEAEGIANVS